MQSQCKGAIRCDFTAGEANWAMRLVRARNVCGGSRGLMDRALDLKPEVTQGCGFESRLWQEVSATEVRPLSKAPNPQLLPGRRTVGCSTNSSTIFISAPFFLICIALVALQWPFPYRCSIAQQVPFHPSCCRCSGVSPI